MKMVFRWFGEKHDSIPIQYVSQIPNVSGVAATLMDKQAGELWTADEIAALKNSITAAGLEMEVIESVNIHDDIKLGVPSREKREGFFFYGRKRFESGFMTLSHTVLL